MIRHTLHLIVFVSLAWPAASQPPGNTKIEVGEWISLGANAALTNDKFIFLDFWATWCAPCLHSMPHVEQLMDAVQADVFFISMTKEGPVPVERHLTKHPMRTAVALDDDDASHDRFDINAIPEAMLFSPSGKLIWRGHPAELTIDELRRKVIVHRGEKAIDLTDRLSVAEVSTIKKAITRPKSISFETLPDNSEVLLLKQKGWVTYHGDIYRLINLLLDYPMARMNIDDQVARQRYEINLPESIWNRFPSAVLIATLDQFDLLVRMESVSSPSWRFEVRDASKLWDDNIIDWGLDSPGYMIGDSQIEVDNRSVLAFCNVLSEALGVPVVTDFTHNAKHDWQLHIKYQDLMLEQLKNEYGVEMFQLQSRIPRLSVSPSE